MMEHDAIFHELGNTYPRELAAHLLGVPPPVNVQVLPRELPLGTIRADFAVVVRSGPRPFVLHAEHFRGRADFRRVLLYHSAYHYARGLPVRTVLFLTDPRHGRRTPREYRFRPGGFPATRLPVGVWRLWTWRARDVLDRRYKELYPYVPLMKDPLPPGVLLRELIERIMADGRDEAERANLMAAASAIVEDRSGRDAARRYFGGIADMAKTHYGSTLVEMGRIDAKRSDVVANLEVRFRRVPARISKAVHAIGAEARLDRLLRLAVIVPTLAAFERALR